MKRALALALLLGGACGGQKLVGVRGSTGMLIDRASEADVPATTGTHGGTTTTSHTTTSASTTSHATSTTSGTTASTTTATTATTTASSTSGCNTGPDLSLANPWTMTAQYNLQQAGLPSFNSAVTDISNLLNFVQTAGLASIPSWLLQVFNILASFDVFFQQLNVTSTLTFTPAGTPGVYNVVETWIDVTSTDGSGNMVDITQGQITAAAVNGYTATVCNGVVTFSSHDISGNLQGLVTPLLDGLVSLGTSQQYNTFSDLITATLNSVCGGLSFIQTTLCTGYVNSISSDIYQYIQQIGVSLGSATVTGTGKVEAPFPPPLIDMGVWHGTDGAGTFNGTFTINGT